jgi:hypothetical protein
MRQRSFPTRPLTTATAATGASRGQVVGVVAKVYGWFTEGLDTADLQDAKTLPEGLS